MASNSNMAVYTSIGANCAIALAKFFGATLSGSSAMVAEGVHSLVDASDGILLLVGQHRSRRPPDEEHPFGHGKELYFWTLIVAIVFFAVGGGVSMYEGLLHVIHPEPLRSPTVSYVVLAISGLFDGISFLVALRQLRKEAPGRSLATVVRRGKDPTVFTLVLEDMADMAGLGIAALGVWLAHRFDMPVLDGVASIGIGAVLAGLALILVTESHLLLLGERAYNSLLTVVEEAVQHERTVLCVHQPRSMQLGPDEVLVALAVEFAPELPVSEVAATIDRVEARVREQRPEIKYIYIEVVPGVPATKPAEQPPEAIQAAI